MQHLKSFKDNVECNGTFRDENQSLDTYSSFVSPYFFAPCFMILSQETFTPTSSPLQGLTHAPVVFAGAP